MRRLVLIAILLILKGCGTPPPWLEHNSWVMGSAPGPYVIRAESYEPFTDSLKKELYAEAQAFCDREANQVTVVNWTEYEMNIWGAMTFSDSSKVTLTFICEPPAVDEIPLPDSEK